MAETEGYVNEVNQPHSSDRSNVPFADDDSDDNQRRQREVVRGRELKRRRERRLELLLTVPSYTLTAGNVNLRHENRARLRFLLRRLVLQHNWVEASGVLSALLKATCRERIPRQPDLSLRNDRMKYSAAMEICRHMETDPKAYSMKIEELYRAWILKIRTYKTKPSKDRYILLEHILSAFARNEHDIANDALKSLKQASALGRDPLTYLVIGLASYELWYTGLLEEMRERNVDGSYVPMVSETGESSSSGLFDDMKGGNADSINETCSGTHYHSEASVVNDNGKFTDVNQSPVGKASDFNQQSHGRASKKNNKTVKPPQQFQPQDFSGNTVDTLDESDDIMEHDQFYSSSGFNVHGFQSLLPFRLPLPENMAHYSSYKDYYNDAVKYLKLAIQSPPPVSEAALLPLVQLLVIGDQVNEAFPVLQQFCNESNSVVPYRLRARLEECVEAKDFDKLSSCFEDVLNKDPTCRRSLTKLIDLHRRGEYATDRMAEMISLHLEATFGDVTIWREYANCLQKLSICDRVSTCINGEQIEDEQRRTMRFSSKPDMFVEGMSGKTWKLRSKWWLTRHFSNRILTSETKKGEWELIVCKAACACHLYGNNFDYVSKVRSSANNYDDTHSSFLHEHINDSLGFFSHLVKKRTV